MCVISLGTCLQPGYEQGSLMAGNVHILSSYSNALMETICKALMETICKALMETICKNPYSEHDVDEVSEHMM